MPLARATHGEYVAVEKFALEFGAAFDSEIVFSGQTGLGLQVYDDASTAQLIQKHSVKPVPWIIEKPQCQEIFVTFN